MAAGAGRVAVWLARRGLEVTALDVSPLGLEHCQRAARAAGVNVETQTLDLESEPLPAGPFSVISCFHYLQRDLFSAFRERLEPGGVLLCELATRRNLERHPRPGARFLLEPNELNTLCAPFELVYYREGWIGDHCLARAIALGA